MPTFDDVRAIAMALPEAEEILTWETDITFRVRKKIFAIGGEGSESVSIKATPATQADLIDRRPRRSIRPPTSGATAGSPPTSAGSTTASSDAARRRVAADRPEAPRRDLRVPTPRTGSPARTAVEAS